MSDNIFGNRYIERQGGTRPRAWHRLGLTDHDYFSAEEGVYRGGLNVLIEKKPLFVEMNYGPEFILDQFAIMRESTFDDPQPRYFGTVGKDYTIIQRAELAQMIDKMSEDWHPETIGALGKGEMIFFAMSTGKFDIKGDPHEDYLLISDTTDGKGGIVFCYTPIRVVCQNTYNMAMGNNSNKVTLNHSQAVKAEVNELLGIYFKMMEVQKEGQEILKALTEVKLKLVDAMEMIKKVYLEPEMPAKVRVANSMDGIMDTPEMDKSRKMWESAKERNTKDRTQVMFEYLKFNDLFPEFAETGYSLLNATTGYEDFEGRATKGKAESALFGEKNRIKGVMFKELCELI